ncbi:PTS ascorbate transporter subunit IIC [Mycolicibacterium vaccae]|uniref:Ascorbate-specific PTS system EIIC component n=1 Tax=Mycolicibacterium vaccae ATCC 25954 TaxID=1194972 RepID=K0UGG2_MYCVA|nr:PTS ascorbate transporter subunit IIC [Mycolicibacterium vaccae]ANI42847.1 PTS ascorbate transporter subunit IIC [Mycolicibacterium vaccae 95051]EJZ05906.1 PTS system ascorbate-specific transporter subunit IIC [Mycolicibacterium vaccae ATCC 25954]MCV7061141.1 PTS ascorbate transporter subunit IIC [Mycolicibacterium vaccae]
MNWLVGIAEFLVNEILAVPAFLIGIITAVGLIALRKSSGQVIGGALKATLGFLLINAGAGLVVSSLEPLGVMIQGAAGTQGVVPTNEAIVGIAQDEYGAQVAWLMILGFAVSLVLARFTPLHYVFLTGHHALFMATLLTIVLATAGLDTPIVILLGGFLLGVVMVSLPALAQPWTKRITGDDSIAIGHFGTLGYIASGITGRFVGGKKSQSTEDLRLPESLRFLRDSMVATALSMVLMYLVVSLLYLARAGQETAFAAYADDTGAGAAVDVGNFLMRGVTEGLSFGVAVAVILFGVRTILGELVPAFQGIAERVVPGAVPALDAPIVFPYAQNAVLIGFISSFVAGLVGLAVLSVWLGPAFGWVLVLPGLVPHFFTGGAAGVYGNATGGRRGAVAGGFVNGLLITFLPALLVRVLGSFGAENTTFGDTDFGWYGILLGNAAKLGTVWGMVTMLMIGVILLSLAILVQKRLVDADWDPSPGRPLPVGAGAAAGSTSAPTGGRSYPKIAPPAGAPPPPPPPQA